MPTTTKSGGARGPKRVALPNRTRQVGEGGPDSEPEQRRGTGRTYRGRESRERLLAAARTVFEREGFLQARVADICNQARLSHGSFYTYFHSKEEVFKLIADEIEVDLLAMPSEPEGTVIERLRAANRHYLEIFRDNARMLAVINQVASFDPDVWATRTDRQDAFAHAIERRIRHYQESGLADPDLDPWFAANALGGMVTVMAEQLFIRGLPGDLDAAVGQLTSLWANAIRLRPEP